MRGGNVQQPAINLHLRFQQFIYTLLSTSTYTVLIGQDRLVYTPSLVIKKLSGTHLSGWQLTWHLQSS